MEPFEINLGGVIFTIAPQEAGTFKIHEGENYIGEIEAIVKDDTSTGWVTTDLMSADLAKQIGELIEEHEI